MHVLRIVSMVKILHFRNTFIISFKISTLHETHGRHCNTQQKVCHNSEVNHELSDQLNHKQPSQLKSLSYPVIWDYNYPVIFGKTFFLKLDHCAL